MILQEDIQDLVDEFLFGTDQFIVKMSVGSDNKINLYIDSDSSVTIDDCVALSRHVEQSLDRESEDFELNVSSAGIDQPFGHLRQYIKNIGKPVAVIFHDGVTKRGILDAANENEIRLLVEKKNKNKKSKKMIAGDPETIRIADIAQTKAIILF